MQCFKHRARPTPWNRFYLSTWHLFDSRAEPFLPAGMRSSHRSFLDSVALIRNWHDHSESCQKYAIQPQDHPSDVPFSALSFSPQGKHCTSFIFVRVTLLAAVISAEASTGRCASTFHAKSSKAHVVTTLQQLHASQSPSELNSDISSPQKKEGSRPQFSHSLLQSRPLQLQHNYTSRVHERTLRA